MSTVSAATHVRENHGLLAPAEKRLLVALARRLPEGIGSDHLTALGLVGMLLAALAFWAARENRLGLLAAIFGLAINWLGDSLDGTVARVRNRQRPRYGFYVDHVVDVFGTALLLAGLGLSGAMSPAVAALLLIAFLMLLAEVFLATAVLGTFRMSRWRLGPTELRIVLAIGLVRCYLDPDVTIAGHTLLLFDLGGVIAALGMLVTLVVAAASNTRTLFRAEPLP